MATLWAGSLSSRSSGRAGAGPKDHRPGGASGVGRLGEHPLGAGGCSPGQLTPPARGAIAPRPALVDISVIVRVHPSNPCNREAPRCRAAASLRKHLRARQWPSVESVKQRAIALPRRGRRRDISARVRVHPSNPCSPARGGGDRFVQPWLQRPRPPWLRGLRHSPQVPRPWTACATSAPAARRGSRRRRSRTRPRCRRRARSPRPGPRHTPRRRR